MLADRVRGQKAPLTTYGESINSMNSSFPGQNKNGDGVKVNVKVYDLFDMAEWREHFCLKDLDDAINSRRCYPDCENSASRRDNENVSVIQMIESLRLQELLPEA